MALTLIHSIVKHATRLLDFLCPKDDHLIVFSNPAGSTRAMYDRVKAEHKEYKAYIITGRPEEEGEIPLRSIRTYWKLMRARFAVSSHGLFDFDLFRFSRRTKLVTTWHGTPMKALGPLSKIHNEKLHKNLEEYAKAIDLFIAASYYEAAQIGFANGFDARKLVLTGQPRNDHLVDYESNGKERLRKYLPDLDPEGIVVLYAPTFRIERMVRFFPFLDNDYRQLSDFLENHNITILLRPHINDLQIFDTIDIDSPRILNFGFDELLDIYEVLGDIDILVTDYSSLAYDFLLLDRPIIYITYDLMQYEEEEGFMINFGALATGRLVDSMKEFIEAIEKGIIGDGFPQGLRWRLRAVHHSHQTSDSTSKILIEMEKLI